MSRIEKGKGVGEEFQQMKGEVIKEIASSKGGHPRLTCSLIFLLVLMGFFCLIAWMIAATGLIRVPGFSSLAYQTPQPERLVSSGVPLEQVVNNQVKTTLMQRLQAGKGKLEDRSVDFRVTEESLTSSLRTLLEKSGDQTFKTSTVQVTVNPDTGFTFFLPLQNSDSHTAIQISIVAHVTDGTIELLPNFFSIGSLPISSSLIAFFLQPFLQTKLADLNQTVGSYVKLNAITYAQGQVNVTGTFAVEIKN